MNDPSDTEIADTTTLSGTFPVTPENSVSRENLTQAILEMLTSSKSIMVVDGPEGIGKTTLLAQFAKIHAERCVSLFVSGSSTFAYNPNMIVSEICDQIGWLVEGEKFRNETNASKQELLTNRIFQLQRKVKYDRKDFFFVIDGLHEIPPKDIHVIDQVLDMLPFGSARFKFIISGTKKLLASRNLETQGIVDFRVVGFTKDDTKKMFESEHISDSNIKIITRVCGYKPGNMASIKRLLASGESLDTILEGKTKNTPDWLELEWKRISAQDEEILNVSGLLAFYRPSLQLDSLSELCESNLKTLKEKIKGCSILDIDTNDNVKFVCDAFLRISREKLRSRQRPLMEQVIAKLLLNPQSTSSLLHLPEILSENNKHDELVDYVSKEHLSLTVEVCDSWVPLHRSMKAAILSAAIIESDGELLRLCLKRAALTELETSDPWQNEAEAYISIGDYHAVSALVDKAPTKEDQLHLLCVFAKSRKNSGLIVDPEINERIESLYKQIDPKAIGRRGVDIAADLLYSFPELAIDLVQHCGTEKEGFINSDIAFAGMSIASLMDQSEDSQKTHKNLSDKIKDPSLQKYINRLSMHVGKMSAAAVIAQVKGWDNPEDRIAALRRWLPRNRKTEGAEDVIFYALDTILKTTSYTANAGVYRQIISPLPYVSDDPLSGEAVSKCYRIKC